MSIKFNNDAVGRTSLSVAFTVGLYGAAFGAAGVTAGFSVLQSLRLGQYKLIFNIFLYSFYVFVVSTEINFN